MTSQSAAPAIRPELRAQERNTSGAAAEVDRCLEELSHLAQTELSIQAFYSALLDRALRMLPAVGGAAWRWTTGRTELLAQRDFPEPLQRRQRTPLPKNGQSPVEQAFCLPAQARASDGYAADHPHPWPLVASPIAAGEP